jgi:hypothetical protein
VNEQTNEHAVMSSMFISVYVRFVIMLIELQKVLSQELKCLCSKTTTVLSESMVPKTMDVSHIFIVLEINSTRPYVH